LRDSGVAIERIEKGEEEKTMEICLDSWVHKTREREGERQTLNDTF
jgi:hypothetical protein